MLCQGLHKKGQRRLHIKSKIIQGVQKNFLTKVVELCKPNLFTSTTFYLIIYIILQKPSYSIYPVISCNILKNRIVLFLLSTCHYFVLVVFYVNPSCCVYDCLESTFIVCIWNIQKFSCMLRVWLPADSTNLYEAITKSPLQWQN